MKRIVLKSILICVVLILGFTFNNAHGWLTDISFVNWGNLNIEPEYIYDPTWWLSNQIWQLREKSYYSQYDSATLAYMHENPVIPLWLIGLDWMPVAGIPDLFPVMDFQYGMHGPPTFGLTAYGSYTQFPAYDNPYTHMADSMTKEVPGYDDKYFFSWIWL